MMILRTGRQSAIIKVLLALSIFIIIRQLILLVKRKEETKLIPERTTETITRFKMNKNITVKPTKSSGFHTLFKDRHKNFRVVTFHPRNGAERAFYLQQRTEIVSPFRYDFLLESRELCDTDTYMVILVLSIHRNEDRRNAIRTTWGRVAKGRQWPKRFISEKIRLGFLLAKSNDSKSDSLLRNENVVHRDIIQGDFIDSYDNMTLKSLLGLKWVSRYCHGAKYYMKADEDIIVNLPFLVTILNKRKPERSIMGAFMGHAPVIRGLKTGDRSWGIPKEAFPLDVFPFYTAGTAYLITTDIVKELFDMAQYVPRINVEDAYITGILAAMIGAHHAVQSGFSFQYEARPSACTIVNDGVITGTNMITENMLQVWKEIVNGPRC